MNRPHCERCDSITTTKFGPCETVEISRTVLEDKGMELDVVNVHVVFTVEGFDGTTWKKLDLCASCLGTAIEAAIVRRSEYA